LLQPFIENSIEHGFKGIDYLGEIKIRLSKNKNFIHCCIEDNGIGFLQYESTSKRSSSINLISNFLLKATKTEVKITNKKELLKSETGLLVNFLIPYKLTEND
jgi:sensor histidine kinase YesM